MSDTSYRQSDPRLGGPEPRPAGGLEGAKARLLDVFGRGVDALESNIGKAPPNLQPAARRAVSVARERPLLTMAGLALGALMLTRGSRRR